MSGIKGAQLYTEEIRRYWGDQKILRWLKCSERRRFQTSVMHEWNKRSTALHWGRDQKILRRLKCSERRRFQTPVMHEWNKRSTAPLWGTVKRSEDTEVTEMLKTEISNETPFLRKMLLWEGFKLIRTGTLRAKGEKRITYSGEM